MIDRAMTAAMVSEMQKIALAAEDPRKALKVGPFSTNVGQRSSIKMTMPKMPAAPPPVGRVTTVGGSSIATQTPGVNLRTPTVASPKMPLTQMQGNAVPPASPVHVAPQTTPQAAPAVQGAPQTVDTRTSAAGAAGQQASGSPAAPRGGTKKASAIDFSAFSDELISIHKEAMEKEAIRETLRHGWKAIRSSVPWGQTPQLNAPPGILQQAREQAVGHGQQLIEHLKGKGINIQRARVKSPASMVEKGMTAKSPAPDDLLGMQFYAKGPPDVAHAIAKLRRKGVKLTEVVPHDRAGYHGVNIKGRFQGTPVEVQASPGVVSNIGQQMEHALGYKQKTEAPKANWFDKWFGKKVAPQMVQKPSWMKSTQAMDDLRFLAAARNVKQNPVR